MEELEFCIESADIWQFVGIILMVFKIVIPLIIIVMGAVDLGKAVVSSDEKEIKKATSSLLRRFIAGLVIFFIPTLVDAIFGLFTQFNDVSEDYRICSSCVANPYGGTCEDAVSEND